MSAQVSFANLLFSLSSPLPVNIVWVLLYKFQSETKCPNLSSCPFPVSPMLDQFRDTCVLVKMYDGPSLMLAILFENMRMLQFNSIFLTLLYTFLLLNLCLPCFKHMIVDTCMIKKGNVIYKTHFFQLACL